MDTWEVFIKDHHEGYIGWAEYERNQELLAGNAYGKTGDTKSGRGGHALLAGLICCARCGRRLVVAYRGRRRSYPTYRCDRPNLQLGHRRCIIFGGGRVDDAIADEMLRAVSPFAIAAAEEAERMLKEEGQDRLRIAELELTQARYDASLAERRYAACDPDNRLIAAQLEKAWEAALQRVDQCRKRLDDLREPDPDDTHPDFMGLAEDLAAAWKAPQTTMRTRQRLVRALITEIVADVDEKAGEIVLVIHWKGGQHSELRVKKPKSGEHSCSTPEQALAVMRSMAGRWSDQDIAASLNRMGMPTGQGKTWTAHRVGSIRRVNGIHGYLSTEKNGEWLTLRDAATKLGVSHHQVRKLIKAWILASEQIMPDAPHQIRAADLDSERVAAALARKGRPCRAVPEGQLSMFPSTYEGGAERLGHRDRADCPLDGIGIEFNTAVVDEAAESVPPRKSISDRFGQSAARRQAVQLTLEPGAHRIGQAPVEPLTSPHFECCRIPFSTSIKYFHEFDLNNRLPGDSMPLSVIGHSRAKPGACLRVHQRQSKSVVLSRTVGLPGGDISRWRRRGRCFPRGRARPFLGDKGRRCAAGNIDWRFAPLPSLANRKPDIEERALIIQVEFLLGYDIESGRNFNRIEVDPVIFSHAVDAVAVIFMLVEHKSGDRLARDF